LVLPLLLLHYLPRLSRHHPRPNHPVSLRYARVHRSRLRAGQARALHSYPIRHNHGRRLFQVDGLVPRWPPVPGGASLVAAATVSQPTLCGREVPATLAQKYGIEMHDYSFWDCNVKVLHRLSMAAKEARERPSEHQHRQHPSMLSDFLMARG